MKDGDTDWGWGILISAARKKLTENNSVLDDSEPQWVLDVFLPCDPEDKDRPPADAKAEGRIFPMALTLVQKISKIRSNMPTGDAWLKILMLTYVKQMKTNKRRTCIRLYQNVLQRFHFCVIRRDSECRIGDVNSLKYAALTLSIVTIVEIS